jgi:hypothetical protein
MKFTIHKIILSAVSILLFWGIFFLFQNQTAYDAVLGKFADNYIREGDNINLVHVPYNKLADENLIHWDAGMYNNIRENFYNTDVSGGDYIYAVFPLFPMIWRLSQLSPTGIIILNMIFFIISIILISNLFSDETLNKTKKLGLLAVALTFPSVVAFFIPYSESTFLIMSAIAIWGLFKKKYWIYFAGMIFMAMTRSAVTFIFFSFLGANIIYFLKHRNIKFFIVETFKQTLPLFIGTLFVALMQLYYNSGSLLKFVEVQKYWGNKFQVPHNIADWAHESFGISVGIIFFIVSIGIAYMFLLLKKNLGIREKEPASIFKNNAVHIKDYLVNLSIIYILGIFFFLLFFRGGCIYGITRYILATPFFYILLFSLHGKLSSIPNTYKTGILLCLSFLSLFFLGLTPYSTYWNFSDFGYFLFVIAAWILCYTESIPHRSHIILISIFVIAGTVWSTYLFNMYLANAWICI